MKRKVSKIGPSTLMISLPNKWVKGNNIKKGDELELIEENNNISIILNNTPKKQSAVFDVSNIHHMLHKFIGALYKAGFDEVKLSYKDDEQLKIIYDALNKSCIGYEIIQEGNRYVIIKQISEVKEEDFENVLRRLFQFLISISEDGLKAAEKNNTTELKVLMLRDDNVNRAADFCRRCLNKSRNKSPGTTYHIIEQLERIGDVYKEMFRELIKNKKHRKEIIAYYKDINEFLNDFYRIFYKFDTTRLEEIYEIKIKLDKDSEEIHEMINKDQVRVLDNLNKIKDYIFEMNGSLMINNLHSSNVG